MKQIEKKNWCLGGWLVLVVFSLPVLAAEEPSGGDWAFYSGVHTGLGVLDEDLFWVLDVEQGIEVKGFQMVVAGPFRFQLMDNSPADEGGLRSQDWDTPSDYARILRMLNYRHTLTDGMVDLHVGEINGAHMGHDSIVSHYYNSMDMDHYHGGAQLTVNVAGNGMSFLLNDVIAPEILASRAFVSPFSWFSSRPAAARFQVGGTVMIDAGVTSVNDYSGARHVLVAGGDVAYRLVDGDVVTLTPYVNLNACDGNGGLHVGLSSSLSVFDNTGVVEVSSEYRLTGADYYPALVNPFYDVNRRFFDVDPLTGAHRPLAAHLSDYLWEDERFHGFMVELSMVFEDRFKLGIRYDFAGHHRPHWLLFRMEMDWSEQFSSRLFFAGQDIEGGGDIFSRQSLMGVSLYRQIKGPFGAVFEMSRRFRRRDDDEVSVKRDIFGGVGVAFSY